MTTVALVRTWAYTTTALWALTALAAALAAGLPGAAELVRDALALDLQPDPQQPSETLTITLTNLRVAALPVLGALAVTHAAHARALFDALLAVVLGLNVALVGAAIGAYGPVRLAPWLMHLPLEWAGLSLPLAAYLHARSRRSTRPSALLVLLAATTALLAVGALVETLLSPHSDAGRL